MKSVNVINLKTYESGKNALKIAKAIEKVDSKAIIGVQPTDLSLIATSVKNPVYIQHVDFFEPGRNTGFVLPEAAKAVGAKGVFLNHSEHKLSSDTIKRTVKRCRALKLKVLIFAGSLNEAISLKKFKPDYLAFEPPELVAGSVSVSSAKPDLIERIARKLKYPFLVGAGIKTNEDLKIAMRLGASGIAVSSAITKAKNPEKELKKMLGKK